MPPDHMTSPPMRFENGLETQPPLPAHARTADADVVNSDTYNTDLKLVLLSRSRKLGHSGTSIELKLFHFDYLNFAFIWTLLVHQSALCEVFECAESQSM